MRFDRPAAVLKLARALAGSAYGLTIDEMAQEAEVSRRTAERMRDAVEQVFGPLKRTEDGRRIRFSIAAQGLARFAVAPTTDELAELENAARACEAANDETRAAALRSLAQKIRASLRAPDRRRLETDVEALARAEAFTRQAGPRPLVDPTMLGLLRKALLVGRKVKFQYRKTHGGAARQHNMIPYGILFGRNYLFVGTQDPQLAPAVFRFDRMENVEITDEPGAPPDKFDLTDYAARAFGAFQGEPEEILLRFSPAAAPDARRYLFHPTQSTTDEDDGSLTVRFLAPISLEVIHHLMTWGTAVTIIAPVHLRMEMQREVSALYAHLRSRNRLSS